MKTHPHFSPIEVLEARIAPAMASLQIVDAHTATYTDADGDLVTVRISLGTLAANGSDFVGAASGIGDQLQTLDLNGGGFDGSNVTFSVVKNPTGDGLVNVGYVDSTGHDLGNVILPGDLGQIDAGDGNADPALASLSVKSMGLFGKATQLGGGSLTSDISGPLGTLTIATDAGRVQIVVDATLDENGTIGSATIGGNFEGSILASGDVTLVKIAGDLVGGQVFSSGKLKAAAIGGSVFGNASGGDGLIAAGEIGSVTIGRDLVAGDQDESGKIDSFGKIASVTIGGSIIGGSGDENTVMLGGVIHAGQIFAVGDIGPVKVGHDVRGGSGDASAKIVARGKLASLTVGGSVIGGSGSYDSPLDIDDGQIFATLGMGPVTIGHDVQGGSGKYSALILSDGTLTSATIGGSILGGIGDSSGNLSATGATGMIKIGHDVHGGAGMNSGVIFSTGKIAGVTVGGSLVGGSQTGSGAITSDTEITTLKIVHNVAGGAGIASGVVANAKIVSVGGSLIGGSSKFSGQIGGLDLTSITIGHDVLGGTNVRTGFISADHLGSVVIHGSLVGGTGDFAGSVSSASSIGSLSIGGDLIGGSISGAAALDSSGFVEALGRIGSITIQGSIIAGIDASTGALTNSAHIRASDDIGSFTVHGSLIGHGDSGSGASLVVISARGQHLPLAAGATTDVAFGKVSIGGRVEYTNILAGFERDHMLSPTVLLPSNADAQIGPVTVGGDWIASNLIAGAMNDAGTVATTDDNLNFGDGNDHPIAGGTAIQSRIASITIAGQVFGSPAMISTADHFGFVAAQVGALKIGVHTFALAAASNTDFAIAGFAPMPSMHDVTLHETGAGIALIATPIVAPAKLVNASTVTFTDYDGDHVTVKLSRPLLTAGNVNTVFKFDHGMVGGANTAQQQLQLIDLGALATNNIGVTVTVAPGGGDGLANVGAITFAGYNAGAISVPGDVGEIAGGANTTGAPGLASLSVRSMGRLGLDAQPAAFGTFTPKLGGEINGGIGALTVKQDIIGANIDVTGPIGPVNVGGSLIGGEDVNSGLIATDATIGAVNFGGNIEGSAAQGTGRISGKLGITSITLGGSLIGGPGDGSGKIIVASTMGAVKTLGPVRIAHDLIGGSGFGAGQIIAGDSSPMPPLVGKITSVNIGGSLLGGANTSSGLVFSTGDLGMVTIAHDVRGGSGGNSGVISTFGKIAGATLGGSLAGGANGNTGRIVAAGDIGAVKIGHDMLGGTVGPSATLTTSGKLGAVSIGGSLFGTAGGGTASMRSTGDMAAVKIGGNLLGGIGTDSGTITAGDPAAMPAIRSRIASVTLGGSLLGGPTLQAGRINSTGSLGAVKIGGNVAGGAGQTTGSIFTDGKADSVTLGGSLIGGSMNASGELIGIVGFGAVTIGGDVAGGAGSYTGRIGSEGKVTSITIHGSMIGGSNATGSSLISTGIIDTSNDIGLLKIDGNLIGGSVSGAGFLGGSGYVESHNRILNVVIGGSMISGVDRSASVDLVTNASIRVTSDIPTFTVKGSLIGNTTANGISPVIISAHAEENPGAVNSAIGKLIVNGSVEHATIFGDYTVSLVADVANAEISLVQVGRNWIASNVVVGVVNYGDDHMPNTSDDNINFGDSQDFALSLGPITHRISSVIIGGTIAGTEAMGDHFGFTAAVIGSFKYAGFSAPVFTAPLELSLPTGDVTVHEAF